MPFDNMVTASTLAAAGAYKENEKIRVGFIGVGLRGLDLLKDFLEIPGVEVVALCDVYAKALEKAMAVCGGKPKPYRDYREVLARKDVDAVVIATLPHWHCLQAIDACEAGKDFYLEKPMSMYLNESLAIHRAVEKHDRITQVGTQIHALPTYRRVVEYVRSGKLGPISVVRNFFSWNLGLDGIGNKPDCDPPAGLDWDMWCGPAPKRRFNPLLIEGAHIHASFMDYSGGATPGISPHILDLPYWALELDHPTQVQSYGGRFYVQDAGDAYDTHEVLFTYPGLRMTWMCTLLNTYGWDLPYDGFGRKLGVYFHGLNGTLWANYAVYKVVPEGDRLEDPSPPPESIPPSLGHAREWLEGIRTRNKPLCHVGYHYKIDVANCLSLISMQLGRTINFDPKTEKIVGDAEAQKLCTPQYRDPWKFPAKYL